MTALLLVALIASRCAAADEQIADAANLAVGQSYRASAAIVLAPARGAKAVGAGASTKPIPSRAEFAVAERASEDDTAWYFVTSGFLWGWTSSKLLAGNAIEPSGYAPSPCAPEQAHVRNRLEEIARDYAALGKAASIAELVALDGRIRKLLNEARSCLGFEYVGDATSAATGVNVEHYGGYEYRGKLLAEAHRMNPESPLRPSTLYSTVEQYPDKGDVPDIRAAKAYLSEFPTGPFAADAAFAVASAYADVYSGLHNSYDEKIYFPWDCPVEQLDDLKGKSSGEQQAYTKTTAESFFQRSFRLRKPTARQRRSYEAWQQDDRFVFYCSD